MAETPFGKLVDELMAALSQYIVLETEDGVRREGKLTSWQTRKMTLNDREVLMPMALELNGDPMDTVDLGRIKHLWVK